MAPLDAAALDDEDMLDPLTIGRRIRQLRSDRGMTLEVLAQAIGRAPSQVSVIENGKRELKVGELQRDLEDLGAGALGLGGEGHSTPEMNRFTF